MSKLTEKQKRFVEEYLIDLNATQAAIRAGYSPKTAYSAGQRLLKNVEVRKAIDERLEKIKTAKTADAQEVMEYLSSVLRGEQTEEVPLLCGEGYQRLVAKAVAAKDRLKAAELLGKRYGIFEDRFRVNGGVEVVIHDDIPD